MTSEAAAPHLEPWGLSHWWDAPPRITQRRRARAGGCHLCERSQWVGRYVAQPSFERIHSRPRRRCLPGQSTSGCTTRMCRVSASLRENVFSSVHRWQRTFCLRALWIVSSCRVRS